jgi:hypothetical protein
MKHILLTTIAAVLLVGCGESQSSAPSPETKPVEPVAEAAKPEPPTARAPDINIHKAAQAGNIEAVKQHLADGTDVNVKDKYGRTPLHAAAVGGSKEVVELLIAKGADVNAKYEECATSLDWAKNQETADLLRKHGGKTWNELKAAEPVAEASKPEPPTVKAPNISIHEAVIKGNVGAVKQHLAAGTDVNAKDKYRRTPFAGCSCVWSYGSR